MAEMIAVFGLTELQRDLKAFGDGLDKVVKAAGKDAADIVAKEAKVLVPKLTGRLQRSIKAGATAKNAYVKAGGLVYAGPIHFGWRAHNIEPQPFIYEAADHRIGEVVERYESNLGKYVDRVIVRGG